MGAAAAEAWHPALCVRIERCQRGTASRNHTSAASVRGGCMLLVDGKHKNDGITNCRLHRTTTSSAGCNQRLQGCNCSFGRLRMGGAVHSQHCKCTILQQTQGCSGSIVI